MEEKKNAAESVQQGVLREFLEMCRIPHQSDHEEAISDYLCRRLRAFTDDVTMDAHWNVVAKIPATEGMENAPVVALQAHSDMVVAIKSEEDFQPLRSEVHTVVEGNILRTDGRSSLGADNGVGVAAVLHMLERGESSHGPLKIIFTSGEEIGLKGARLMDAGVLDDVRYLINLDGFHSDRAIVGCMGGKRETFRHALEWEEIGDDYIGVHLEISGMLGGHSGEDISLGRCNAIRMMAMLLREMWKSEFPVRVEKLEGGEAANVIPRSCRAHLAVPKNRLGKFYTACEGAYAALLKPFAKIESTPHYEYITRPTPEKVWTEVSAEDAVEAILGGYDGVYAMSTQVDGCVGASSNLGQVTTEENELVIRSMVRCEADDVERKLLEQHRVNAGEHRFSVDVTGYRAWHQNADNPLTHAVEETYLQLKNKPITVTIAPVGLEPACFHEKAPWLNIVTLGADIRDAHATTERVKIDSMETMYRLIVGTVEKLRGTDDK